MVAYATGGVFVQAWIGAEDKLPRMVRAVYRDDPAQLRHQMELSNWQLDVAVPTELFASEKAASATPISFCHIRTRNPRRGPNLLRRASHPEPSHPKPSEEAQRIMKTIIIGLTGFLISALWSGPAAAWASANRYGGSTEHVAGVGTEHTNAYGGSSEHAYGGGSEHTNMYGGTTAGKYGEGAVHTRLTARPRTIRLFLSPAPTTIRPLPITRITRLSQSLTTHPDAPAAQAAAGAVVGVAAGAAIASANTAAATSNAYSAGVAAGNRQYRSRV